jgi:hypothetical protein
MDSSQVWPDDRLAYAQGWPYGNVPTVCHLPEATGQVPYLLEGPSRAELVFESR